MILNQPAFFARSATLDGAISDTDTQITLAGLSTRFTDAVAAGTVRYPAGPFRVGDVNDHERIAITGHVSGSTFDVERGIQGTGEEAWADGTAVRAVVTRSQLTAAFSQDSDITPFVDEFFQGSVRNIIKGSISTQSFAEGRVFGSLIFNPGTLKISGFGVLYSDVGSDDGTVYAGLAPFSNHPITQDSLIASGVATKDVDAYKVNTNLWLPAGLYMALAMHTGFATNPDWYTNRRAVDPVFNFGRSDRFAVNFDTNSMQAGFRSVEDDLVDLSTFTIESATAVEPFIAVLRT